MAQSIRRLSLTQRQNAMQTTRTVELTEAFSLFQARQRALNHSEKTLVHYDECFGEFTKFLAATDRWVDCSSLTTAIGVAFPWFAFCAAVQVIDFCPSHH